MQLTRAADYGVRVMIALANTPQGERVSHAELAGAVGCPPPFLAKVLQRLTRAGLVVSHRGNVGGFEIKKSRRSVSVLQVVEAVEGPLCLNICVGKKKCCSRRDSCPAHPVWAQGQAAVIRVLSAAMIDELARRAAGPETPASALEVR
jgi:Rrf2 family protein